MKKLLFLIALNSIATIDLHGMSIYTTRKTVSFDRFLEQHTRIKKSRTEIERRETEFNEQTTQRLAQETKNRWEFEQEEKELIQEAYFFEHQTNPTRQTICRLHQEKMSQRSHTIKLHAQKVLRSQQEALVTDNYMPSRPLKRSHTVELNLDKLALQPAQQPEQKIIRPRSSCAKMTRDLFYTLALGSGVCILAYHVIQNQSDQL